MKITSNYYEVKTSNGYKQFSFSNSPTVFKILSDSLYKNKIGSIIRELCSNAKDSHIAAGKKDVPFEVILPVKSKLFSNESPQFKVIDHGVGLSEEDIYKIYTVYGESNKSHSNDFIGGFGIGSKSPFSYTDEFNIVSIYNNKKTFYCAFINSEGFPSITKLYSEPTTEENGVEISLNVEEKDINEFEREYTKQIRYFNPKPICNKNINFEINKPKISKSFWEYNITYNELKLYLRIADIEYTVELDKLYPDAQNCINLFKFGTSISFNIPIGSIDLTASRESISYTEKTKETIDKYFCKFIEEIKEYFIKYAKDKSEYEVSKYASYLTIPVENLNLNEHGFFNSFLIPRNKLEDFCNKNKIQIYVKSDAKKLYDFFKFCDITFNKENFIVLPKYNFYKVKNTIKNCDIISSCERDSIIIKYSLPSDIKNVLDFFKNPKCEDLNIVEYNIVKDKKYTLRYSSRYHYLLTNYNILGRLSLDKIYEKITNSPKILVLASKGNDIIFHPDIKNSNYSLNDISSKLSFIFTNKIYYENVVVLPITTINDLKKYKNYSYISCDEFYNFITKLAKEKYESVLNKSDRDNYLLSIAISKNYTLKRLFDVFHNMYNENEVQDLIKLHKIFKLYSIYLKYNNTSISSYLSIFTEDSIMESYHKKVKEYENIVSEIPILELVQNSYYNSDKFKSLKKCVSLYINVRLTV